MWDGFSELQDIIFLITFIGPILVATYFGSISYDGWRHLYFIYPCLIFISIRGLEFISNKITFKYSFILTLPVLIFIAIWMIKNHPFQFIYCNKFAGKNTFE